ncbi:MAG: hypothetical protein RMZ42_06635 [Nostoc sp. DedQUE05]|uniref:hypothetical protein n=1 Tax=Nostoc sp. DedQUE05 TaxID=3075391 RepID=UPI002AD51314|nr:hypothetical protein [Nostoc sp. DedQUE05]MDZ8091601.1 hypothetical protein [Nostoc sp. DedQUE05]
MTPEVKQAIAEIKQAFPEHPVDIEAESNGGAYIIVNNVLIGEQYIPSTSWVGFVITFQYPHADVYPHFIDGGLRRVDGGLIKGDGLSGPNPWRNRPAIQVSRRSKRLNPAIDTAATKLTKVISWLRSR